MRAHISLEDCTLFAYYSAKMLISYHNEEVGSSDSKCIAPQCSSNLLIFLSIISYHV